MRKEWERLVRMALKKLFKLNFQLTTYVLANSLEYPERIHRGLEWTQLLKRLIVCLSVCSLFFVSKFSHFSFFHSSLFIQYSTEECSTVQLFIYKIIAVMIDIDTPPLL